MDRRGAGRFAERGDNMAGPGPKLVTHAVSDVTIVRFDEPSILEAAMVERLGLELYRLVDQMNRTKLILDFSKVQFLASGAVGVVISLQKKVAAAKGKLVICALRRELTKVFQILKIEKLFTFCADEAAALKIFGFTAEPPAEA
jgi:anti-anti-sigma factor